MKTVDARGYACPLPVIMVQKEVLASAPAQLTVVVDDKCAVENVTRFGASQGYEVTWRQVDDEFELTLKK